MKFNLLPYTLTILSFVASKAYDNYYGKETVTITQTVTSHKYYYNNYNAKTITSYSTVYKCTETPTAPTPYPSSKPKPKPSGTVTIPILYPSPKPDQPKPAPSPSPSYEPKPQPGSNYPGPQPQDKIIEMLCRVNQLRAEVGKKPYKIDAHLMDAAQKHSIDQAERKQMSHTGSKIPYFFDRIKASGYKAYTGSENVAWNQKNIEHVMRSWKNSSGHYQNIIGDYDCFGWGEKDLYWTQVFAKGSACTHQTLPNCPSYPSKPSNPGYPDYPDYYQFN